MAKNEEAAKELRRGSGKIKIVKPEKDQPLRIWIFVIGLNLFALLGFFYLKSKGIDLYSFRAVG